MSDPIVAHNVELVPAHPTSQNPALVYLASLAPTGRRSMRSRLDQVGRILGGSDALSVPWHLLRFEHLAAIRARLVESGAAPATVNVSLCAVRGVAAAAFNLGQIGAEDLQRLKQVKSVRGERLPAGRALSSGEATALLDVCANDCTPAGARDAAVVGLLYGAGLRRAEVVGLDLADFTPDNGELRVTGKGGKQRMLYLRNGGASAMADWLAVRGIEDGPLFLPIRRGGRLERRRMSTQAVYDLCRRRAIEARVAVFSPHDFRRTFVGDLLDLGADIVTVQKLAGHASVTTTARYDRRPEEAKRRAMDLRHVPYRSRRLVAA